MIPRTETRAGGQPSIRDHAHAHARTLPPISTSISPLPSPTSYAQRPIPRLHRPWPRQARDRPPRRITRRDGVRTRGAEPPVAQAIADARLEGGDVERGREGELVGVGGRVGGGGGGGGGEVVERGEGEESW